MALICDTSGVFALYDADNLEHAATRAVVEKEPGPLLLSVLVLGELRLPFDFPTRPRRCAGLPRGDSETGVYTSAVRRSRHSSLPRTFEPISRLTDRACGRRDRGDGGACWRRERLLSFDYLHFRAIKPRTFDHFILLRADQSQAVAVRHAVHDRVAACHAVHDSVRAHPR
jgi:hypothetical protein